MAHIHCPTCGVDVTPQSDSLCGHCGGNLIESHRRYYHGTVVDEFPGPALDRWVFAVQPHSSMTVEQYGEFINFVQRMLQENAGSRLTFTIVPRVAR